MWGWDFDFVEDVCFGVKVLGFVCFVEVEIGIVGVVVVDVMNWDNVVFVVLVVLVNIGVVLGVVFGDLK